MVCQRLTLSTPPATLARRDVGLRGVSGHLRDVEAFVVGHGQDHHPAWRDLLDSPPKIEKRKDPKDGLSYTMQEVFKYYGKHKGRARWDMASPDEFDVARAQSNRRRSLQRNTQ